MTAEEQAIHDVVKQVEGAWNAGDSKAFAANFAVDANFIHIFGGQLDGRPAIEESHRLIFDGIYKGSRASFTPRSIRFVRPEVAIVFNRALLKFMDGNESREMETRPTFTMVKEKGEWQIVAFQNTRVTEMPPRMADAALTPYRTSKSLD